jgi:hypothetical protein
MNIICYSNSRFLFAFSFLFALSYSNYPLDFCIVFVASINEEILFKFWKLFQCYQWLSEVWQTLGYRKLLTKNWIRSELYVPIDSIMIVSVLMLKLLIAFHKLVKQENCITTCFVTVNCWRKCFWKGYSLPKRIMCVVKLITTISSLCTCKWCSLMESIVCVIEPSLNVKFTWKFEMGKFYSGFYQATSQVFKVVP